MRLSFALLLLFPVLAVAQTICIDPGHISETSAGTKGKRLTELHVNWRIASLLAKKLRAQGYKVVMTKSQETQVVTNKRRAEIANGAKADLFLRLHCDASAGSGWAVYYPSQMGQAPDGMIGPTPKVIDMSHRKAVPFYHAMQKALKGKLQDNGLRSDVTTYMGRKQGGALTGSIYSRVPVVLVEMVVLTNKNDEATIGSAKGEQAMVDALAAGIAAATRSKPAIR